jgi:hypothetical protein
LPLAFSFQPSNPVLRNTLYYRIKPFVPLAARMTVRRWFALRKRARVSDVWPILPGSEKPPTDWPGWPEGKQFALVLTHDVEGRTGLARCRQLMELEMKLGFRSSFNLVPEGEYQVSSDLREELVRNGFEVGVHDLHHDGKLYQSRRYFSEKARRINHYLKAWGASGFRSAFMHNNLDWLHELDISYDASTFDTDPFEPQPKGRNTIFPFWVPARDHATTGPQDHKTGPVVSGQWSVVGGPVVPARRDGYVELPYTLPQDSTMFLLFQEKSADLWKRKLDWIAQHGGMVLLDTHPDYMAMNGGRQSWGYPVDFYEEFLEYAMHRYSNTFWHALPKDVAHYCRQSGALGT